MRNFAAGFLSCLLLIAAVGVVAKAVAETWAVVTVASWHYASEKDYEENNYGLGFEHPVSENLRLASGVYRNSHRRDSLYFGLAWAPLRFENWRGGLAAMLVGGYETKENQELLKALFPVISYEEKRFGINIPLIPETKYNAGLVALQLKWKFQ